MPANVESEMEEGEIVDELDDLSDISSEEEFLLRQRLEVLENYNNVLERKKAKCTSDISGVNHKNGHNPLPDLSEISATELEDNYYPKKKLKQNKHIKVNHKQKRKNVDLKNCKSKGSRKERLSKKESTYNKKRIQHILPESSDESEDEYKYKRIKLANAVNVNNDKIDKSSLSARLKKMLCNSTIHQPVQIVDTNEKQFFFENNNSQNNSDFTLISPLTSGNPVSNDEQKDTITSKVVIKRLSNVSECIDLCSDDQTKSNNLNCRKGENIPLTDESIIVERIDIVDSITKNAKENVGKSSEHDSDEDLELLRQNVLKTKIGKTIMNKKNTLQINYRKSFSDDEDSDTAELRLICLRSALLKKAIEMKQKQKLQKKLSQSNTVQDDITNNSYVSPIQVDSKNNTDTESVDMDIGSEDEKLMQVQNINSKENSHDHKIVLNGENNLNDKQPLSKYEEFEEDEDLLRAQLLTSLSKNLPNLINPNIVETIEKADTNKDNTGSKTFTNEKEQKKFIIELRDSESEGENEATANLTKMHMKLSEQIDFQQKLDMFLKCTRMEVENSKPQNVIQKQETSKKTEKFVAKAVNNLPKSEQIEYKNLVKRMTELEKIKLLRQNAMVSVNKDATQRKEILKPNTVFNNATSVNNNLEEQINTSRKKIAEESAKMMRLKEESKKLSQKYNIVATELRNITTAIALNKKQQRSVQNCLTRIRLHHQTLLKRSTVTNRAKLKSQVPQLNQLCTKIIPVTKLQKENDPMKDESINSQSTRTVSVLHNKEELNVFTRLSIQVNFTKDEIVKKTKISEKLSSVETNHQNCVNTVKDKNITEERIVNTPMKDKNRDIIDKNEGSRKEITICNLRNKRLKSIDDYQSPLEALGDNWEADPNAILCPFEVGGECRDMDCKYLHTKITQ